MLQQCYNNVRIKKEEPFEYYNKKIAVAGLYSDYVGWDAMASQNIALKLRYNTCNTIPKNLAE